MSKQTITLVVNKISQEEIANLRKEYKDKGYRLNLFISGEENYKSNIKNLIRHGA